jgi:4a-hydroxytetrahydrobiopterin dehydratase
MPRLDDTAVAEGLQRLPGRERRGNQIAKTFMREDFAHAIVFVNEVASAAEAAGHHPDIDIRWNTVTLALSSHDEGGLTDRDFQLAARIQELDHPPSPPNRPGRPDGSAPPSGGRLAFLNPASGQGEIPVVVAANGP